MAPLAKDHVITDHVALQATDKLFSEINIQSRLNAALPKKASFVAAPITNELHGFVQSKLTEVLRSSWFQTFWESANRRIHTALVNFLEGKQSPAGQRVQRIAVNLSPVLDRGITKLDQRGITVFDPLRAKLQAGTQLSLTIASKPQVKTLQRVFNLANQLGWFLPLVALLLVLAGVIVATDRRKTLLRMAVGVSMFVLVLLGVVAWERNFFITHASGRAPPAVTGAIFDILNRFLQSSLRWALLAAVLFALLMWFIGPAGWATAVRRSLFRAGRSAGRGIRETFSAGRPTTVSVHLRIGATFLLDHASGSRLVGVVVAGCFLIFGGNLSPWGLLWTLVGLAIYLVAVQVAVLWARHLIATPQPPEATELTP